MRKSLSILFLISVFAFKASDASAQLSYDEGYIVGYQFAMDKLNIASDAHPEWALYLIQKDKLILGVLITTYFVAQDDYQRHQLAVNWVNVGYLSYILSMKDVDASWNGYYFGYLQATADFEIGM